MTQRAFQQTEEKRLKPTNWKDIAELFGIAAIVASLVFVGIQLNQDREVALSEVAQFSAATYAELQIAMADHADSFSKLNRGENLSEPETFAVKALVNAMHRQVVTDALERRQHGVSGNVPITIFAIWLHLNPGARAIWINQRSQVTNRAETISSDNIFIRRLYDEIFDALTLLDEDSSRSQSDE